MNIRVILSIVKKDIHGLLPLILLACAVFVAQPMIANLSLENEAGFWSLLQTAFYWLGYFLAMLLMVSVVQLDPATSLNHDWLTRPIARPDWLSAKLVFLALTVCAPVVAARFIVNMGRYGVLGSLEYAAAIEFPLVSLAAPIVFTIALLTPTLKRTIGVLVVIFMIFMVPAWDGSRYLLARIGIDVSNNYGGMMWLQSLPILAIGLGAALLVYWLLYCRRRLALAWMAFGTSFVLVFLCIFPPSNIFGWDEALTIHKWMINEPDDSLDNAVMLEPGLACFRAAAMDGMGTADGANPILQQAAWEDSVLARSGRGAVTFASVVNIRDTLQERISPSNTAMDVTVDWRVDPIRARARLTADSIPSDVDLIRSSAAAESSVGTDYWLVPGDVVDALAHDPSTRLILDYDLAVLAPTSYELATDGQFREFPELGTCRAEIENIANRVDVVCIKQGRQPALVSAQLVGVPGSLAGSFARPDYSPGWLESVSRRRYELSIDAPSLVDSSVILINAYDVERILHERLESPGILGGPPSVCPLPGEEPDDAIEGSSWSDNSPHELRSVAVERGIRVEVLDWRSGDRNDRPVLFLIPGLGATAHSYDEIAPKLAQKYGVVGMTRRGIGGSSRPDHGYDIARLSQDVIQVLDTLDIESPILVGASIGGEELSFLGANSPERVSGLIYLDAAYDRVSNTGGAPAPVGLLPGRPPPMPSDYASYEAIQQYYLRTTGSAEIMPEGEYMALYDVTSGTLRPRYDLRFLDAIEMGLEPPAYPSIPLPALGIFAVPSSPDSLMQPWYDRDDPFIRDAVESMFEWQVRLQTAQITRFSEEVENSEVRILYDADHRVVDSNEADVLDAIDAFIERL